MFLCCDADSEGVTDRVQVSHISRRDRLTGGVHVQEHGPP